MDNRKIFLKNPLTYTRMSFKVELCGGLVFSIPSTFCGAVKFIVCQVTFVNWEGEEANAGELVYMHSF